jgi:hypothetical protein
MLKKCSRLPVSIHITGNVLNAIQQSLQGKELILFKSFIIRS